MSGGNPDLRLAADLAVGPHPPGDVIGEALGGGILDAYADSASYFRKRIGEWSWDKPQPAARRNRTCIHIVIMHTPYLSTVNGCENLE